MVSLLKQINMEKYLQEKHAETYIGIDDNMPDDFDRWLLEIEVEEWILLADRFKNN